VLAHRLILRPEARLRQFTGEQVVQELLDSVPIPVEAPVSGAQAIRRSGVQAGKDGPPFDLTNS
jgi:hypothetical protein